MIYINAHDLAAAKVRLKLDRVAPSSPNRARILRGSVVMRPVTRRSILASTAILLGAGLTSEAEAATGAIRLHVVSGGFIVGVGGGDGVLTFRGVSYPLTLSGVSVGATIGVAGADLVGRAYNLQTAQDIEGAYSAGGASVAVAGGGGVMQLSNAKGVVLRVQGRQVGFKLSLAVSGLTIAIKQ
jgi:hypothetical protein